MTLYPTNECGSPVELGAQWIHGQVGNNIYEEAMALDPNLVSKVYQEDGSGKTRTNGDHRDPNLATL